MCVKCFCNMNIVSMSARTNTSRILPLHGALSGRARGFALLAALMMLVLVSLAVLVAERSSAGRAWREREEQLLFVGDQYRRALLSYHAAVGGAAAQYPATLDALLHDERFPSVVRHLRRLYPDPVTGKFDWILELSQGRIVGVHSASQRGPQRHANFPVDYERFSQAVNYAQWRFEAADGAGSQELSLAALDGGAPGDAQSKNTGAPAAGSPPAVNLPPADAPAPMASRGPRSSTTPAPQPWAGSGGQPVPSMPPAGQSAPYQAQVGNSTDGDAMSAPPIP